VEVADMEVHLPLTEIPDRLVPQVTAVDTEARLLSLNKQPIRPKLPRLLNKLRLNKLLNRHLNSLPTELLKQLNKLRLL
jgi:hypothetical protein